MNSLAVARPREHHLRTLKLVRKHPGLTFFLALVLALGLGWMWWDREPEYQGKPYSYWMAKFCFSNGGSETELMVEVFRGMGPEGARYLARLADEPGDPRGYARVDAQARAMVQGSALPRFARVLWGRLVNVPAPNSGMELSPPFIRYRASQALMLVRPKLEALGPEFAARFTSANAESRHLALAVLAALPEAAQYEPQLIEAIRSAPGQAPARIVEGVCLSAGAPPKILLAALDAAGSSEISRRAQFMYFLSRLGPSASNAVPVLLAAAAVQTNHHARFAIGNALLRIAPSRPEGLQTMESLLLTTEYMAMAARALQGWRQLHEVPTETLVRAMSNPEVPLYGGYAAVLAPLLPVKTKAMVTLGPAMKAPDVHTRIAAAVLALQLEAEHPGAVAVLLEAARTHAPLAPGGRGEIQPDLRAVQALGDLRPAAGVVVPELKKILETAPEALKPALGDALRKYERAGSRPDR